MDADTLSQEFADSVLPVTIIIGILAVLGLVGNTSVIYVYKWKYSKCNFCTFVLCLAIVDFTSCLFVFPTEMAGHRIWFSYPISAAWFCKLKTSIYATAVFVSSYILLLISIDRFRKVCRPIGWQISQKVAFRLCLFIFGLCMILIIPCPILFGIQTSNITYEEQYVVITSCGKDDNYKHSVWITIYVAIFYYVTVISFMVTTMVLYGMILRKLFCGNFLKEIDHTEELKRRSRLQMAEFSEDESRDGFFSSDTFLDLSSTCADEHNIKDEPKLIKIESGDRLCIQYTDRDGSIKTETIKYTTNAHTETETNSGPTASTEELADISDTTPALEGRYSSAQIDKEKKGTKNVPTKNDVVDENEIVTANKALNTNSLKIVQEALVAESKENEIRLEKIRGNESDLQMSNYVKSMPEDENNLCDKSMLSYQSECDDFNVISDKPITDSLEICDKLENKHGLENDGEVTDKQNVLNSNIQDPIAAINSHYFDSDTTETNSNGNTTERILLAPLQGIINKAYVQDAEKETNSDDKIAAAREELENQTTNPNAPDTDITDSESKCSQELETTKMRASTENNSKERDDDIIASCKEIKINDKHRDELEMSDTKIEDVKRTQTLKAETAENDSKRTVHFDKTIEKTNAVSKETTTNTALKKKKSKDCDKHDQKHKNAKQRIRNKSLIMFVVTLIFNITTLIYFCIFTVVIRKEHIFEIVTPQSTGVFFFFWRVYFINHVINPVVYGSLDPRFRHVVKKAWRKTKGKQRKHSLQPH